MKTTIEKEKLDRAIQENVTIYEIAKKGSLIPFIVCDNYDENKVVEVLFCETISGGRDELNNMPRELSLIKLKLIDGELHRFTANYLIKN